MSFNNLDQLYRTVIMDHYKNPRNKGSLEENSVTIDMNNPTCGDRIHLTLKLADGVVEDAKFDGEGCSISMSSASMMTQIVKGKSLDDALELAGIFSKIMLGEEYDEEKFDLGDVAALQGVAKFPARIKCATLAWKAMEKGVNNEKNEA